MAEALKEHSTQEVVDHNQAIEALKKEVETLEAEKDRLIGEVGVLVPPALIWRTFGRRLSF